MNKGRRCGLIHDAMQRRRTARLGGPQLGVQEAGPDPLPGGRKLPILNAYGASGAGPKRLIETSTSFQTFMGFQHRIW